MSQMQWKPIVIGLTLLGVAAPAILAQDGPVSTDAAASSRWSRGRMPGYGFATVLDQTLGLTPEQRDSVRGLLAQQREQTQTLRQATDAKIRALLTPDQQKKFDELLAKQKSQRSRSTRKSPAKES
ncbi:MAG TPA: hypothetical protein VMU17_05250 [Elusimicrobiota bacterium]|nr:hypothetical protein [Elusimicrobiota bacterium]